MQLESKISLKTIGAQPRPSEKITARAVAHVFGSARGYFIGQSTYGEFYKFRGDFEATNVETGEVYRSANLLLPDVIAMLLVDALHAAGAKAGKAKGAAGTHEEPGEMATAPVEFAIEVGIRPRADAKPGTAAYEWTVKPLTPVRDSDPLQRLREEVKKATAPQLSHDKPATAPAGKAKR